MQHRGAAARRMRSILDVSGGGCYIVSRYQNHCFEERRHYYENADRARFRVDYAGPFGRLPAARSASGDDDGPSGRGSDHGRRRRDGRGGSERTTPTADGPRVTGPSRRHGVELANRAHLRLHGLPLQQARGRRPASSTSIASCCCSTTASPIASASSASSSSSTRSSKASRKSGELELEQAYLDFLLNPAFNFRAGMLLVPVGIINERHEPPSFYGVERPFVDTVHHPDDVVRRRRRRSRRRSAAAGATAPTSWRRSTRRGFTADEGLARGAAERVPCRTSATSRCTGRLEYVGYPRARRSAPASGAARPASTFRRDRLARRRSIEFDGRYRRGASSIRGEFAQVFIDGAGDAERRAAAD